MAFRTHRRKHFWRFDTEAGESTGRMAGRLIRYANEQKQGGKAREFSKQVDRPLMRQGIGQEGRESQQVGKRGREGVGEVR